MNFYSARPLMEGPNAGKFHYTCHNDNQKKTWPVGDCAKEGHGAHDTEEEACECYRQYILREYVGFFDDVPMKAGVTLEECKECKEITTGGACVGYGIPTQIPLCKAHRTHEMVAKHYGKVGWSAGSY